MDGDIIATMLRWLEDFVERPHVVVGNLPVCPFAKAARLNQTIQWEVRRFVPNDPLHDHGELLTLVRDFGRASTFETLFVVHPEPAAVSSSELDAFGGEVECEIHGRVPSSVTCGRSTLIRRWCLASCGKVRDATSGITLDIT